MPITPFNAAWLMQQEFPPTKYVVPGIVPEGMTLLVASPKIGKSWMVLGLALDLSNGGEALGCLSIGRARPVLYLALEDGQRRLQNRIRSLNPSSVSARLEFVTDMAGSLVVETIKTFMVRHATLDPVVILDTLGKVMPPAAGNQSAYGHDYAMLSALKSASDAVPGSSLVIVHHTRKHEGGDFLDAVSGTQGIAGAADTVIHLKRERHEKRATLQVTSRDVAEGEYAVTMAENGAWTLDGGSLEESARAAQTEKSSEGVGDRMAEIIQVVGRFPQGIKPHDVAVLMDLDDKTAQTYLSRAFDSGRILRPVRGTYTPVGNVGSVGFDFPDTYTNNTTITPVGAALS